MNAIFDLKKTMIVALVALACSTASARPGHTIVCIAIMCVLSQPLW